MSSQHFKRPSAPLTSNGPHKPRPHQLSEDDRSRLPVRTAPKAQISPVAKGCGTRTRTHTHTNARKKCVASVLATPSKLPAAFRHRRHTRPWNERMRIKRRLSWMYNCAARPSVCRSRPHTEVLQRHKNILVALLIRHKSFLFPYLPSTRKQLATPFEHGPKAPCQMQTVELTQHKLSDLQGCSLSFCGKYKIAPPFFGGI